MIRKVLKRVEIDKIENMILADKLCLSNIILDAEQLTRDGINNIQVDEVENILLNEFESILINNMLKDTYSNKNLVAYKIDAILQFKNNNYRINEWLVLNKKNNILADPEVMDDNDHYL